MVHDRRPNLAIRHGCVPGTSCASAADMTLAIDLHPSHTDDFVTATGGVRSNEQRAAHR
jgi:hypothetical protein